MINKNDSQQTGHFYLKTQVVPFAMENRGGTGLKIAPSPLFTRSQAQRDRRDKTGQLSRLSRDGTGHTSIEVSRCPDSVPMAIVLAW